MFTLMGLGSDSFWLTNIMERFVPKETKSNATWELVASKKVKPRKNANAAKKVAEGLCVRRYCTQLSGKTGSPSPNSQTFSVKGAT